MIKKYLNTKLEKHTKKGNTFRVKALIKLGANEWNRGLWGSCFGGYPKLANLMISKGATDWELGLMGSCRSGNRELVDIMISKGATWWSAALWYACLGGNIEIVNLMIEYGGSWWDTAMVYACLGGHPEIVKLMISKGADVEYGLIYAYNNKLAHTLDFLSQFIVLNRIDLYRLRYKYYGKFVDKYIKAIDLDLYNASMIRELVLNFGPEWTCIHEFLKPN